MKKFRQFLAFLIIMQMIGPAFAYADNDALDSNAETSAALVVIVEADESMASDVSTIFDSDSVVATVESDIYYEEQVKNGDNSGVNPDPANAPEHTIVIDGVTINNMTGGNTAYKNLEFSFHNEDGIKYEACISGLKISYYEDCTDDDINHLCSDIAASFYSGETFDIRDSSTFCDKYKVVIDPIDTEKVHYLPSDENPNTDQLLCWAASASDMLQFSGWGKVAGFDDENALFDYYEKSYTDHGSSQETGTKWFFNAVNTAQQIDNENGYVINGDETISTAQEKWVSTEDNYFAQKNGGILSDYCEETVENHYEVVNDGYDALYDAALTLKDGQAVGLGIFFYLDGERHGGHAITLMGYIKEAIKEGFDSIKAFFIADSDNDKNTKDTRQETIDSVTMYSVVKGDLSQTIDVYELGNYDSNAKAPLLDYTVLKPYDTSIEKESAGTKDAINNIDYAVVLNQVIDARNNLVEQASVGDEIYFSGELTNTSYSVLNIDIEPYYGLKYTIKCDGEIIDTFTVYGSFDAQSKTAQAPNKSNYFSTSKPYTLKKAGDYSVTYELLGVYYDENEVQTQIPEAYTLNNVPKQEYTFTVKETKTDNNSTGGTTGGAISVPTYKATFSLDVNKTKGLESTTGNITFSVVIKGIGSGDLYLKLNGKPVNENDYSFIFNNDGTITVEFTKRYIKSLLPGSYQYKVVNEFDNVVAVIDVTIK